MDATTGRWLIPALGFVLVTGLLRVTIKLALRNLDWARPPALHGDRTDEGEQWAGREPLLDALDAMRPLGLAAGGSQHP